MGSTKNNPYALSKVAGELLFHQMTVQQEVTAVLSRLQNDSEFAQSFDQAAFKQDEDMLLSLFKEGGMEKSEMTIEVIDKDVRIKVSACFMMFCFSFEISW